MWTQRSPKKDVTTHTLSGPIEQILGRDQVHPTSPCTLGRKYCSGPTKVTMTRYPVSNLSLQDFLLLRSHTVIYANFVVVVILRG